jgi:hypothetical protein
VPEEALLAFSQIVDESPGITLADLHRAAPQIPTDWINIAIAKRLLYVDMLAHRLTERERTPVYRNEATARAFPSRTPISSELETLAHPVVMEQGQHLSWDGRSFCLANIGETEITLISQQGTPFPLARTAFELLVKESKIAGAQARISSNFTEEGRARLERASEQDLATAIFRHRVIHVHDYDDDEQARLAPKIAAIPERTNYHWRRLYREGALPHGRILL